MEKPSPTGEEKSPLGLPFWHRGRRSCASSEKALTQGKKEGGTATAVSTGGLFHEKRRENLSGGWTASSTERSWLRLSGRGVGAL